MTCLVKNLSWRARLFRLALAALCAFCAVLGDASQVFAADSYEIEVAFNDEHFVINGEKFSAKTYCLGWEEGERVIFVSGSPNGSCSEATLYNLNRREKCEVWCE